MSLDAVDRPSRTSQPHSRTKIMYSKRRDTTDHHAVRCARCIDALHRTGRLVAPHRDWGGGRQRQAHRSRAQPQAPPFSVKADGAVLVPVKVPVKPIVTALPGWIVGL